MDETYIKLNGKWVYLYRAVDKEGNTIDFLLRARRDAIAARAFFRKAFRENGRPDKVTVDKSGSNKSALLSHAEPHKRQGHTILFVAVDHKSVGFMAVADSVKPTIHEVLKTLQADGIRIVMLTGDNKTTAGALAPQLGIQEV